MGKGRKRNPQKLENSSIVKQQSAAANPRIVQQQPEEHKRIASGDTTFVPKENVREGVSDENLKKGNVSGEQQPDEHIKIACGDPNFVTKDLNKGISCNTTNPPFSKICQKSSLDCENLQSFPNHSGNTSACASPSSDTQVVEVQESVECMSLHDTPFPQRPSKPATNGRKIKLYVNCFQVSIPNETIYHYDVAIFPKDMDEQKKDTSAKNKYRVLKSKINHIVMLEIFKTNDIFKNINPVFDGQRNMFTIKPLNFHGTFKGFVCVNDNGRNRDFEVGIKLVARINLYEFLAVYEKKSLEIPKEVVMVIDIILRYGVTLHLTPIGYAFYVPPKPEERNYQYLGEGKEVWFGCHQSFRPGKNCPVLNMDKAATVFIAPMSVIEFVQENLRCNLNQVKGLTSNDTKMLTSEMKFLSVSVTHTEKPREYRIVRVSDKIPRDIQFTINKDGREETINVEQYFLWQYNLRLRYPHLPCLQMQPEQKGLFMPMEVCQIVNGQHYRKKFSNPAKMIEMTASAPEKRFKDIERSLYEHVRHNGRWLSEFKIGIETQPMRVLGRVLDAPKMKCANNNTCEQLVGSWNIKQKPFVTGAKVSSWVILCLSRRLEANTISSFAASLQSEGIKSGMSFSALRSVQSCNPRNPNHIEQELKSIKSQSVDLVVIILPGKDDTYYKVKTIAETHVGIKTQCILEKNVKSKPSPSLLANVLLKINKKMGGTNYAINTPERPKCLNCPTMIVSADVCHSSPGEQRTPSIAAAVGSMDFYLTTYHPVVKVQHRNGEFSTKVIEIIDEFGDMMLQLLKEFKSRNNRDPEKIVVYRDGVSEGQFEQVRDHEIRALMEACYKFGGKDYKPFVTFLIVDKRHHIRFRPAESHEGEGRDKNIPPGTVIDTVVTHPIYYDFFLCSHLGLRGTSRLTRYCVLWDDNEFSADEIQKLTYFFCYNYASCNKAVSTPAAARYADMLAGRARQHLLGNEHLTEDMDGYDDLSAAQQAILVCPELTKTMYFM